MPSYDRTRPFDAIRRELEAPGDRESDPLADESMRLDAGRLSRTGIPEVVYAEFKTTEQVIASLEALVGRTGHALAARCRAETLSAVADAFAPQYQVDVDDTARTVVVSTTEHQASPALGGVGIIAAGTSDGPIAREAATMARSMGCVVVAVNDVGVAGLHRLVRPLEGMMQADIACIIVVAGMDGALPSVVAGLVSVPVIGLPTSVGYGYGGRGEAALASMLQTCVPGLVVVNIDNGIGAGATAALIAQQRGGRLGRQGSVSGGNP